MSGLKLQLGEPPAGRQYSLLVDRILEDLAGDDREALEEALLNPAWSNEQLSRVLARSGVEVSQSAIRTWRKRNA